MTRYGALSQQCLARRWGTLARCKNKTLAEPAYCIYHVCGRPAYSGARIVSSCALAPNHEGPHSVGVS